MMVGRRRSIEPTGPGITASATVVTAQSPNLRTLIQTAGWQAEAWRFYDSVGELRFGAGWVANALSRVRLVAAAPPSPGDQPVALEEGPAVGLVRALCGGTSGQAQMQASLALLLTVAGVGYVVAAQGDDGVTWMAHSNDEIRTQGSLLQRQVDAESWVDLTDDDLLIKAWRPHPRFAWLADAPTRAVLPTLAEIEVLTAHIHASAQSRLAGAGVLVIPSEAVFPKSDPTSLTDDFDDLLVEAMTVPIKDRSSAAAVVPLLVRVPGAYADAVRKVDMSTPLDDRVLALRDSAIRRLAVGLDMPPEVLTGLGQTNHWNAWAIQDEAITLHVEPLAEVICHAFTVGYLRPALEAQGLDPASALVWFDTAELRVPPDRSETAVVLFDRDEITGRALRRETGFTEEDAPTPDERAQALLRRLVLAAPALASALAPRLGLDVPPLPEEPGGGTPTHPTLPAAPSTVETPPERPGRGPVAVAAAASWAGDNPDALLIAADLCVRRALERAGTKLRQRWKGPRTERPSHEMHVAITASGEDVTSLVPCDVLLADAWQPIPLLASHLGIDPRPLEETLDAYTRALLATGHAHDLDRLASALGLTATR